MENMRICLANFLYICLLLRKILLLWTGDDQSVSIQMRGGPEPLMVTGWMQIMSLGIVTNLSIDLHVQIPLFIISQREISLKNPFTSAWLLNNSPPLLFCFNYFVPKKFERQKIAIVTTPRLLLRPELHWRLPLHSQQLGRKGLFKGQCWCLQKWALKVIDP